MPVDPASLTIATACATLRQFLCSEQSSVSADPDFALVQAALKLVREHSDYQIFGICADTTAAAITALQNYLVALGYEAIPQVEAIEGPVYLKYNAKTQRCHLAPYVGEHRGVLVSCQSAYDGDVNETFGHLPLNLFQ